jgi:hypothetical protein
MFLLKKRKPRCQKGLKIRNLQGTGDEPESFYSLQAHCQC